MLGELSTRLLRPWWLPAVPILLGLLGGWLMAGPTPTSFAEIVVVGRITDGRDSALTINQYVEGRMSTYVVVARSNVLRDEAAARAGVPSESLDGAIKVTNPADTTSLVMQVEAERPEQAQIRARAVVDALVARIGALENSPGGQRVSLDLVSPPSLPTAVAGPGSAPMIIAGLLVGVAVGVAGALSRLRAKARRRAPASAPRTGHVPPGRPSAPAVTGTSRSAS